MFKKFPFYRQPDTMDCGPTCLRMVLRYYGKNYSLQELRERCDTNRTGSSLLHIKTGAEKLGFHSEGFRLSFAALQKQKLPCIAYWKQQHYVVVYKITNAHVYVSDPSHDRVRYTYEEFLAGWGDSRQEGIVLTFQPAENFRKIKPLQSASRKAGLRYLFNYVLRFRKLFLQLLIGMMLGSLLLLLFPFITQSIVDNGIKNNDLGFIYLALLAQLLLFAGRMSTDVLRSWIMLHISSRVNMLIAGEFFIKLMKLPVSFFDRKMGGDILQRIEDTSRVEYFLTSWSLNMLFSFFSLVTFSTILAIYSFKIFLVFLGGSILYIGWVLIFMKKRADIDYKRFQQVSGNQSKVFEIVNGMQEIKTHNAEQQKKAEWEKLQLLHYAISLKGMTVEQWQNTGSALINELKNIFVTFLAARLVIDGSITLGMMLSVSYIIGQLNGPISQVVTFSKALQDALLSLGRLTEIYDLKDEDEINRGAVHKRGECETLHISGLSFTYPGNVTPALKNISLEIPANRITAIVGSSGSGKTTLMKLLLGFYPYTEGRIRAGEDDLQHINTASWRACCGVVMQEGYIFSDTVARNIALGEEEIDEPRLLAAIRTANLGPVIENLPMKLETKIGNEGAGLSTGQKQRILIARAVYKNPEYLFFDEATSALDSRNEKIITENLAQFFANRTAVIIAHRLSTVKHADHIIVLENGTVAETGTHDELVAREGVYFQLIKNQLELAQ